MSKNIKGQDRAVLRLKLRTVDRLIRQFEDLVEQFDGEIGVLSTDSLMDGATLLELVNDRFLSRLVRAGVAKSLIQEDLARAARESARSLSESVEAFGRKFDAHWERFAVFKASGEDPRLKREVIAYAYDLMGLVKAGLKPAARVRQELIEELDQRLDGTTARKKAKQLRNDRIKRLAQVNRTTSPAELERIAADDPVIKQIGEPVTREIIRNTLKPRPRRQRGKKSF